MGRSPRCSKDGLKKGAWTATEDKILVDYIKARGEGRWSRVSRETGLKRCGKSCRLRWMNYLRPDIKRGNISPDEEELISRLHKLLGNRWSLIAGRLPGRTDNEIKNYWNTNLAKKADEEKSVQSINLKDSMTTPQPVVQIQPPALQSPNGGVSSRPHVDVALGPHPIDDDDDDNNNTNNNANMMKQMVYGSDFSDGSLSLNSGEENSSDLMMDFNMDDLCLILDSDMDVHATGVNVLNQQPQQDHKAYDCKNRLSEEMEKNTLQDDMVSSDFQSLISLFEPDEKWRVDDA